MSTVLDTPRSAPVPPTALPGLAPLPARRRKRLSMPVLLAAAALVLAVGGVGTAMYFRGSASAETAVLPYTVTPTGFDVKVKLSGELKAIKTMEVRNLVEGTSTILSLVPEGKRVEKGELLVTLASDAIKEKVEDAQIRVENAKAALVNSQESLKIQLNQNESDTKQAEMAADLAKLEYEQFDQGDSKIELSTRQTALDNAKIDLTRKTDDLRRVKELFANGFVSNNDVLDAEIAFGDSKNKLATAEMNLKVWNQYAEPKQRQTLTQKRDEAAKELGRVKQKAEAARLLKAADVAAKDATLRVETRRLKGFEEQLANCEIHAPQSGMVVYQSSVNSGWGGNQGPIEEGAQVRQNQTLIQLPEVDRMQVEVRLAEQLIDRVKKGLTAVITIDVMPGKTYTGHVETISVLPDNSNRWMNPNLKEYPTQVILDSTPEGAKPGQSAKVEIMVARLNEVLAVPIQAVFVSGGASYVYVGSSEKWEKRTVKVGLSSAEQSEIVEGLKSGETVLLSRPKGAQDDTAAPETRPGRKGKDAGAKPA